jgi:hypothetical protein
MYMYLVNPSLLTWLQIHHVDSEQWLGALLHANDELVTALMTFEQLDRSIDADSDSDDEMAHQAHMYRCKVPSQQFSLKETSNVRSGNRKEQGKRCGSTACRIEHRSFEPGTRGSPSSTTETFSATTATRTRGRGRR